MPSNGDVRIQTRVWNGASYTYTDVSNDPLWDWNIQISGGRSSLYDVCQASSCSLSATMTQAAYDLGNIAPGTQIQVQVYDANSAPSAAYQAIWTGIVSEIELAYSALGTVNNMIDMKVQALGPIAAILNQTWYNTDDTSQSMSTQVNRIVAAVNSQSWYEVDPALAWNTANPTLKWNTWDKSIQELVGNFTVSTGGGGTWMCSIPVGERNVWDDLNLLATSCHGTVVEKPDGLTFTINDQAILRGTLDASEVTGMTTIMSRTSLRNSIAVTYDGGTFDRSSNNSIYAYGQQSGAVTTVLDNVNDALTIGGYIVNGYASPTQRINSFDWSAFAAPLDANYYWLANAMFASSMIQMTNIPQPFSTVPTVEVILNQYAISLTRDSANATFQVEPKSVWLSSPTWQSIGFAYTWTSYGVAFPTKKWSDL